MHTTIGTYLAHWAAINGATRPAKISMGTTLYVLYMLPTIKDISEVNFKNKIDWITSNNSAAIYCNPFTHTYCVTIENKVPHKNDTANYILWFYIYQ